jgi:hypothetical protein
MLDAVIDCAVALAFFALTYGVVAAAIKVGERRRTGGAEARLEGRQAIDQVAHQIQPFERAPTGRDRGRPVGARREEPANLTTKASRFV